jgi:hypothetical protein
MVAPHFHNTKEVKAAIKKIEHNTEGTSGPPTGIMGGSASNMTTKTANVEPSDFDGDNVKNRGIADSK